MITVTDINSLRQQVRAFRGKRELTAFVPTMGYLHEGHLSLVRLAHKHSQRVIVSIFVNPTQFNDPKDYEKYPVDLVRDSALLEKERADVLYVPDREQIYGERFGNSEVSGFQSWIEVTELSRPHEGQCRPGHFRGVSTVVAILFNIVQPDFAVFGEKDFQQLRIIERMVADLHFPIKIIRGPLIREQDGLAMSSRNVRLSKEGRTSALLLSQGLFKAQAVFAQGERNSAKLCSIVEESMKHSPRVKAEYVRVVDEEKLVPLDTITDRARLILAAHVDDVRLIDNIALG